MQISHEDEMVQKGEFFTLADVKMACSKVLSQNFAQDFLTWMTPRLRQQFYKCRVSQATRLLTDAIRYDFGVDQDVKRELALKIYEKVANEHHSVFAFCRAIQLQLQSLNTSSLDPDEVMHKWLLHGLSTPNLKKLDMWTDVIKPQKVLFEKLKKLLEKWVLLNPQDSDSWYMLHYLRLCQKKTFPEEEIVGLIKLADEKHIYSMHSLLALSNLCKQNVDLHKMLTKLNEYVGFLVDKKYYIAFPDCAKYVKGQGDWKKAMQLLKEGWIVQAQYKCGTMLIGYQYSYEEMTLDKHVSLLSDYLIICLTSHDYLYEYLYTRRFMSKTYPDWKSELHDQIEKEFVCVIMQHNTRPDKSVLDLEDEFMLTLCYFLEDLSIDKRCNLAEELTHKCIAKNKNPRLYLYFMMKLLRRTLKQSETNEMEGEDIVKLKIKITILQDSFISSCRKLINNTDSSTSFYRLARCYQKGYGLPVDLGHSYLLYLKTMEQLKSKHLNLMNTSFTIFYCINKTVKKLEKLKEDPAVKVIKEVVRARLDDGKGICNVCMSDVCDTVMYPCLHVFCRKCYIKFKQINESCPMCRARVMAAIDQRSVFE